MTITRRRAVKILVAGAGTVLAGGSGYFLTRKPVGVTDTATTGNWRWEDITPIDRSLPAGAAPARWFGDEPDRVHPTLWANAHELPESDEHLPLVIVGGGMSGLITAYLLRDLSPVIIEQATRFGGNAKGQEWQGLPYSIGAAYVMLPDEGDLFDRFYREIGVSSEWKETTEESGRLLLKDGMAGEFWDASTDPARKSEFDRMRKYFESVLNEENGEIYPDMPYSSDDARKAVMKLDQMTFYDHLLQRSGGKLHPHIHQVVEHYCWTSFGASSTEISAAAGMNFYAAEFGGAGACPGGNSYIAERVLSRLRDALPSSNLRPGRIVHRVRAQGERFQVAYIEDGKPRSLTAGAVVMACPKFIAGRVVEGLEQDRLEEIKKLEYRSYLVANVLIEGPPPESGAYETFLFDEAYEPGPSAKEESERQGVTDFIFANYAHPDENHTVITLYRALPYSGARTDILPADRYGQHRANFEKQLLERILPALRVEPSRIKDLRLSRWGHPLPLPRTGFFRDGAPERLRRPFREKMFFVQQDNWAMAAIETAIAEAHHFAPLIRKAVGSG